MATYKLVKRIAIAQEMSEVVFHIDSMDSLPLWTQNTEEVLATPLRVPFS